MSEDELTHTDEQGAAQMVDVGGKAVVSRRAVATGDIRLEAEAVDAIRSDDVGKGRPCSVITTALLS